MSLIKLSCFQNERCHESKSWESTKVDTVEVGIVEYDALYWIALCETNNHQIGHPYICIMVSGQA